MVKVVFLDFDGVLNSESFVRDYYRKSFLQREPAEIDPVAVARLNRILEATGAVVCISSSWRLLHKTEELVDFLKGTGFTGKVIGITPRLDAPRGMEIQEWMDTAPGYREIESFVILDDDADMAHLGHRLVQTDFAGGLEDHHIERAIRMLEGEPS